MRPKSQLLPNLLLVPKQNPEEQLTGQRINNLQTGPWINYHTNPTIPKPMKQFIVNSKNKMFKVYGRDSPTRKIPEGTLKIIPTEENFINLHTRLTFTVICYFNIWRINLPCVFKSGISHCCHGIRQRITIYGI